MSLSKALGRFPGMEPVAGGCGLGCAVFTSSSSIPETRRSVGLFLSIICGVSTVYSSLRPQQSLSGICTALEPQQREASMSYAYISLPPGHPLLPDTNHMAKAPLSRMQGWDIAKIQRSPCPSRSQQGSSFSPSLSF